MLALARADRRVKLDLIVKGLLAWHEGAQVVAGGAADGALVHCVRIGLRRFVLAVFALVLAQEGLVAHEGNLEVLGAVLSGCARWDAQRDSDAGRDLGVACLVHVFRDSSRCVHCLAIHRPIGVPLVPDLPWLHDAAVIRRLDSLMLHCRN